MAFTYANSFSIILSYLYVQEGLRWGSCHRPYSYLLSVATATKPGIWLLSKALLQMQRTTDFSCLSYWKGSRGSFTFFNARIPCIQKGDQCLPSAKNFWTNEKYMSEITLHLQESLWQHLQIGIFFNAKKTPSAWLHAYCLVLPQQNEYSGSSRQAKHIVLQLVSEQIRQTSLVIDTVNYCREKRAGTLCPAYRLGKQCCPTTSEGIAELEKALEKTDILWRFCVTGRSRWMQIKAWDTFLSTVIS